MELLDVALFLSIVIRKSKLQTTKFIRHQKQIASKLKSLVAYISSIVPRYLLEFYVLQLCLSLHDQLSKRAFNAMGDESQAK